MDHWAFSAPPPELPRLRARGRGGDKRELKEVADEMLPLQRLFGGIKVLRQLALAIMFLELGVQEDAPIDEEEEQGNKEEGQQPPSA